MILQSQSFFEIASVAVEDAFRTLLENKHLYQSVEIATSGFAQYVDREAQKEISLQSQIFPGRGSSRSKEQILEACRKKAIDGLRKMPFQMKFGETPHQKGNLGITVSTIKAICQNQGCGALWPHNVCADPSWLIPASSSHSGLHQIFILRYQCQACKKEPVSFLVRREGLKLTLAGRSPMEAVDVPKYVPTPVRKFYKGAVVAFNSGAILPGLFMLRTMIEQHMREKIKAGGKKMTGEEIADAYAATLDPDFSRRCQSLKPVYVTLSEAIHGAIDDKPEIFDREFAKILSHFEAKEIFERLAVG